MRKWKVLCDAFRPLKGFQLCNVFIEGIIYVVGGWGGEGNINVNYYPSMCA